jgi:hypothetical protein
LEASAEIPMTDNPASQHSRRADAGYPVGNAACRERGQSLCTCLGLPGGENAEFELARVMTETLT